MRYRVCKSFDIESGHMLSKHPGRCRYPHGHSRRVDVIVSAETLDDHDMVCDFKALKLTLADYLDRLDHALVVNKDDPSIVHLREGGIADRVIELDEDPTTEVLARLIYERVERALSAGETLRDAEGSTYQFPSGIRLERVRVTETPSSWAEYGRE
ncbi:MAG: 6-carboxytetrahydropterin synthase [Planctomycetota bacterium]